MKLKLDENLGSIRVVSLLRLAGYQQSRNKIESLTATPYQIPYTATEETGFLATSAGGNEILS
ncbi:hypothetical protein QUB16_05020 [Microcoleus sp. D3_18a_C4]